MSRFCTQHSEGYGATGPRGFTLVELLVSLAVVSVAASIFVSFYSSSVSLARTARDRAVAAELAHAQLNKIIVAPEAFRWEIPEHSGDQRFPIKQAADDPKAGLPFDPPAALPANVTAHDREAALYQAFRWKAYGRAVPEKNHYQVTVAIHWEQAAREQVLALSSVVPRHRVTPAPPVTGPDAGLAEGRAE